jgi:small neutral amino acid transporter SnatA (MarC family)
MLYFYALFAVYGLLLSVGVMIWWRFAEKQNQFELVLQSFLSNLNTIEIFFLAWFVIWGVFVILGTITKWIGERGIKKGSDDK